VLKTLSVVADLEPSENADSSKFGSSDSFTVIEESRGDALSALRPA